MLKIRIDEDVIELTNEQKELIMEDALVIPNYQNIGIMNMDEDEMKKVFRPFWFRKS